MVLLPVVAEAKLAQFGECVGDAVRLRTVRVDATDLFVHLHRVLSYVELNRCLENNRKNSSAAIEDMRTAFFSLPRTARHSEQSQE